MKNYKAEQLRNLVLLSHGGAGKTSLTEAMLYDSGGVSRLGKVEDGTTAADYDPEEIRRKISVNTAVIPCEWREQKINVLDTPGYADFVGEVKGALRAADGAIIVLDAVSGVEVGTELVWGYADEVGLPRMLFVNKMDRENADFGRALSQAKEILDRSIIPFQLPIGAQEAFEGVVDLVSMKAYRGDKAEEGDIPDELRAEAESYHLELIEAAAETDDALLEKYFEEETLTDEEIRQGLTAGIRNRGIVPVFCGSALENIGVWPLMDAVVEYLPSPADSAGVRATNAATGEEEVLEPVAHAPLAALVFKTLADPYVGKLTYFRVFSGAMESDSRVFNSSKGEEERVGQLFFLKGKEQAPVDKIPAGDIGAVAKLQETTTGDTLCDKDHPVTLAPVNFPHPIFSAAIAPRTKADMDKLGTALSRLTEEDPTLRVEREASTRETVLSGMGESHIDIAARRLDSKFGVEIVTSVPKVPYRETVTRVATSQYRHKKQTGGAGQFAEVWLRVEPLPRGTAFEYESEVREGHISKSFIPSIEKGIKQVLVQGVMAGYPVVDVKAVVYDGKEHPVDSKDIAFQIAGREAFKEAVRDAGPVILEPIMMFAITVPEANMGDVLGDLNTKRARVVGTEQKGDKSVITAQAPLAEMQNYATDLRSMTQGRGIFSMEFLRYEEVPKHLADEIIARAQVEEEKD
ncbi:MAG: elongation factor G [Anaerolineae bacterium]|nr:elongation factor G [Anaerolineae bacterium]NIN97535.1 elongation factor G [Anaerolineae bacterium]NIQ80463.1 elongation factor G [Anaerolineae bacterium]